MPTLTIDNQTITVAEGMTVLEAAEQLGIRVPHYCYHKALGAVGACRMCAVTVHEGSFKGLKMSCLIQAEEGMVVTTDDPGSQAFRKSVGEWLMLNHPHDCPVCDEGGECQLQEMTIASGHGIRRYQGPKRTYTNQDLGPFIAQEMNRCIQCYRCVRTYQDYCGGRDFGTMGSRNRVFFGRFCDGMLQSDFSGNLVDVCPTGVFTDRTFRFTSRFWDLQEAPSICPHCSLGCATVPGGRLRELQRVRSGEQPAVNGTFICDRGRFGSDFVNHPERPRQARNGEQQINITDALRILDEDARTLIEQHGPEAVLLLGSDRASLEANWLLQQWARRLNCRVPVPTAHRARQQTAQVAAFELSGNLASLADVRSSDLAVVIGCDPLAEAPLLALALRQVTRNGGRVLIYDPRPVELPCPCDHQSLAPLELLELLTGTGADATRLRELLDQADHPVLIGGELLGARGLQELGNLALKNRDADRKLPIFPVLGAANSFGSALLSLPEQEDLLTRLDSGKVRMLVCLESDPLLETPEGERFSSALTELERLVVLDCLPTPLSTHADLFIPTCPPAESHGTFVNNEGRIRPFSRVIEPGLPIRVTGHGDHPPREFSTTTPGGEPLPATVLLQRLLEQDEDPRQLRRHLQKDQPRLAGLETATADPVSQIRVAPAPARRIKLPAPPEQPQGTLQLVVTPARYGSDLFSRYSRNLKPRFPEGRLLLHPADAEERALAAGETVILDCERGSYALPLGCSENLARGCALLENHRGMPQLVPGAGLQFCQVSRRLSDA